MAQEAEQYFRRIKTSTTGSGGIPGEATDPAFSQAPRAIELNSVNWSATSPGGSRVSLNRLEVLKRVDSASPALFQRVATGQPLPSMELFVKKGGTTGASYLRYRFTRAFVTSVSPSGDSEAMQERVTFEYASLAQRYQQPDAAGNPAGTVFEAGWNQLANMACTYGTCERITP